MEVLGVQSEFSTFGPKTHKEFYYTPCLTKTELKRMESVYPLDSPIKTEKFPRHASIYLTLKSDISATGLELKNLKHIKKKKLSENVDDYLTSRRTFSNLTTRTLGTSREVTTRASSAKRTNKMVKSNLNLLANKIYKKIVKK